MKKIFYLFVVALCSLQCSKSQSQEGNLNNGEKETLMTLVNQYRSKSCKCGVNDFPEVPALSWDDQLAKVALAHSQEMKSIGKLNHYSANGDDPGTRLRKAGYRWTFYAENVAQGYISVEAVMQGWMNSPLHCANIMNDRVAKVGLGRSGDYWTLLLAR